MSWWRRVLARIGRDRAIGLVLAFATTATVLANEQSLGIARDEVVYYGAGSHYASWWTGLVTFEHGVSTASITSTFGGPGPTDNNREHPPLLKTLSGLSHRVLHDRLGLLDELTAYRLPAALLHGACAYWVFAMALAIWGLAEGVLAALALWLLPRALFHAGLACFDAPIMALWFATIYAYWRALAAPAAGRRAWPWQVGVVWGLALATKHNAILLPAALGAHYAIVALRSGGIRGVWTYRPRVVLSLALLGPLTLLALWPWLWLAPIAHVREWLAFHMTHVHYNFEYLGANWNAPRFPWHVAVVTTLLTVPVATLAAAAIGVGAWLAAWRNGDAPDRARAPGLLLALSAAVSLGPFFLGTTPIFGAEKHWMPALPSLCIAAGVGAAWAARRAGDVLAAWRPAIAARASAIALAVVGGSLVLAAASETIIAQPYALSWYNALAGGAAGGADLGMNRQFWGIAARGALPLVASLPPGRVYSHDASPAWGWYQKLGLVPRDYPDAGMEDVGVAASSIALVIHEKHFNRHDYMIWRAYGTVQPAFVLRADGVPIVSIYKRRER